MGAGIAAAAEVANGVIGGLSANFLAEKNAQLQWDNWKSAFDYEANYNTPKNQLQRLYDAHINPLYNSEFSSGNSVSGGMSTGSLPTSMASPANFNNVTDAYLREKEIENQTRHVENEEKQVHNETIRTEQELLESKARIENLQHQNNKSDAEVKELEQQVAASKAYVQLEQRKTNNMFLDSMIKSRMADIQSRSVSNQYELGKFANATDRFQASINDARLKFEQGLYKEGGYYDNMLEIAKFKNKTDRKQVEVEESRVRNETTKLNNDEFLKFLEQYRRSLNYKGFGFGPWKKEQTMQEAMRAMVVAKLLAERLQNLSPSDPIYVKMLNLWNETNQDAKYDIMNLQNGTPTGIPNYYKGHDGKIDYLSPSLQNIRTSGSLYNPTQ